MEPEKAASRKQLPNLEIMLQTTDGGKTLGEERGIDIRPDHAH